MLVSARLRHFFLFFSLFLLFLLNSLHNSYPDEFDNIIGGRFILQGKLPYVGFFSHHGPLAYFLSSLLALFSGQSFVRFRLLTPLFFLVIAALTYKIISRDRLLSRPFLFAFFFLLAISATYYWGHMFLADSLASFFLLPGYILLFLKIYHQQPLTTKNLGVISLFSSFVVLTAPTYIYVFLTLATICLWYVFLKEKSLMTLIRSSVVFAIPYLGFLLYLVITESLFEFLYQVVTYNQNYYISNYPRPEGSTTINPVRYAVVIFNNFLIGMHRLLPHVKDFWLDNPLSISLALGNVFLWITLLVQRKYTLTLLAFLATVYSSARGDPSGIGVTGYQAAVYVILGLFHGTVLFPILKKTVAMTKEIPNKASLTSAYLTHLLFWFFLIFFFFVEFWRMNYARYMGTMPLIYDRPQVAKMINTVVPKDHYCWVGPFELEEIFHLQCQMPGKYFWLLPQFNLSTKIQNELLAEFSVHKPDIIVYNRLYSAFGKSAQENFFFLNFLREHYVRINDIEIEGQRFVFSPKGTTNLDFDEYFYFEKTQARNLIGKLYRAKYLKN